VVDPPAYPELTLRYSTLIHRKVQKVRNKSKKWWDPWIWVIMSVFQKKEVRGGEFPGGAAFVGTSIDSESHRSAQGSFEISLEKRLSQPVMMFCLCVQVDLD
jgi:hypothetical protein